MKKTLLSLSVLFLSALTTHAQTDVTSTYLDNADFSSGTAVTTGICTYAKDVSTNSADGSSLMTVDKWTAGVDGDAKAGGLFTYGSSAWCGKKADNYKVPATNPDGATSGNALGIIGVWTGEAYYTQAAKTALKPGKYTITFKIYNSVGTVDIDTNKFGFVESDGTTTHYGSTKTFTVGQWTDETVTFTLTEETSGTFSVGYKSANKGTGSNEARLFFVDNVKIEYTDPLAAVKEAYETALTAAQTAAAKTDPVNSDVKKALSDAISSYSSVSSETSDAYTAATEALTKATTNFNACVTAYATAANVLPKMLELTQSTNFYTTDAYNTYYKQWKDKYDASTLTTDEANALQDPTSIGYHKVNTADDFLLGSWTNANTTDWAKATLYINTWSTEGASDGSNMTNPFFEYWNDATALPANTFTGSLSGLTADQLYQVSVLVRVKSTAAIGSGITMQVGDGTTVDVCRGTASTSAGYYYGTFTAYGKADSNGTLTVKFIVADGNNISWLSFKNVKYAEAAVDYTALNNALSSATALNSSVTNGVTALTSAITTAQALLSSTSQTDVDNGATTLNAAITSAQPVVAARLKANGYYKKYTALNTVIKDETQNDAIAALKTVYENASATADEVTSAIAAVTLLNGYTKLDITNGTFDNSISIDAKGNNTGKLIGTNSSVYEVESWDGSTINTEKAGHAVTAAYGAPSTNGTNSSSAPVADMFGKSEGGVLQISSGWDQTVRYTQSVNLPAGQYVFYYEAYNANTAESITSNYFGIRNLSVEPSNVTATSGNPSVKKGSEDVIYANENTKTFSSGDWTACAMSVPLTQAEPNATVSVGVVGNATSSSNAAKLWVDNVEVYYYVPESYTRTATSSGYGTICLPYAAQAADNVTVYEIAGVNSTENPTTLYLSTVSEMVAGTPYIYYAAADAVFTQATAGTVDTPVAGKNNLTGVLTGGKSIIANGSYILSGGKWYKVDNSSDFTARDYSAYISSFTGVTEVSEPSNVKTMNVIDSDATGINAIENASTIENGTIYTLSGQRVSNLTKGGIYIVNGKKVFVK